MAGSNRTKAINRTRNTHENIARLMLALAAGKPKPLDRIPENVWEEHSGTMCAVSIAVDGGIAFSMAEFTSKLKAGDDYDWILAIDFYADTIVEHCKEYGGIPNENEYRQYAEQSITKARG